MSTAPAGAAIGPPPSPRTEPPTTAAAIKKRLRNMIDPISQQPAPTAGRSGRGYRRSSRGQGPLSAAGALLATPRRLAGAPARNRRTPGTSTAVGHLVARFAARGAEAGGSGGRRERRARDTPAARQPLADRGVP